MEEQRPFGAELSRLAGTAAQPHLAPHPPHADLLKVWRTFTEQGLAPEDLVPPPILQSWRRCRAYGLDPLTWPPPSRRLQPAPDSDARLHSLRPLVEDLHELVEGTNTAVVLTDAAATIAESVGEPAMLELLERLGLLEIKSWREIAIGTNALALALQLARPFVTCGAAHFHRELHQLAIAAAPLFDMDGHLFGGLALVTPAAEYQPYVLGMAATAARLLEHQVALDRMLSVEIDRMTETNAVLSTMNRGLLFLNEEGRIVRLNPQVEGILGLPARSLAGHVLADCLRIPDQLRSAIEQRTSIAEQEMVFVGPHGPVAAICSFKTLYQHNRYLGAYLTLHSPEHVRHLVHEIVGSRAQITFNDIIGESPAIQAALRQARACVHSTASVLLIGEHGTGKEMLARAIHQASSRAQGPFITLDCSAVPRTLIGADLFGSEGSGDGKLHGRPGKLELAHGGTLFLIEANALPREEQTALLRALETRHVIRQGGQRPVPIDVRIITSARSSLQGMSERFRPDLAKRLSGFTIQLPPLRAREGDILLLINHFLHIFNERLGKHLVFSPAALAALQSYPWPGNTRELEEMVEQIANATEHSVIELSDLPPAVREPHEIGRPVRSQLSRQQQHVEREAILQAARTAGGHLGRTAQQLGISRSTLWRKMREHGLDRADLLP